MMPLLSIQRAAIFKRNQSCDTFFVSLALLTWSKAKEEFWDFPYSSIYSTCLLIDFLCNQIFHSSFLWASFFCRNKEKSISKQVTTMSLFPVFSLIIHEARRRQLGCLQHFCRSLWRNVMSDVIDIIYHLFIENIDDETKFISYVLWTFRDWWFIVNFLEFFMKLWFSLNNRLLLCFQLPAAQ